MVSCLRVDASGLRYRNAFVTVKRSELPVVPWVSNSASLRLLFSTQITAETQRNAELTQRAIEFPNHNTQINMLLGRSKEL